MENALKKLKMLLAEHSQSHLLAFWDDLNQPQKKNLLSQLQELDFTKIDQWVADYIKNPASASLPADFTPPPSYTPELADDAQKQKYAKARKLGESLISDGKVAAFIVAGGQGTRLGFDEPKGNFPISPIKNKTLFRIFAESIAAASKKYQTACPWYVMTSPLNYARTCEIFRSNNYFGLNEKNVFIFQQGTLPNFDFEGRILLADKDTIASSPDGHGGSLKALYKSGALQDMKKRGVEFISYFQVDNPLVHTLDTLFIGLHALDGAQMSSKAVLKTDPQERVGIFCLADGKVKVVEYSDLPDELAQKRDDDGSLTFNLASIAVHIISCNFVDQLNTDGFSLPLHKAVKKIPHIDQKGKFIEPEKPNGVKLETFVFDALESASKSIILQTHRSEEFAPVKNADGPDSPATAKKMMIERAAAWLESAGIAIPKKQDGSIDAVIEIAPSFALDEEDIKEKLDLVPEIKPGDNVYLS